MTIMLIFRNLGYELLYSLLITLSTLHLSFVLYLIILGAYAVLKECYMQMTVTI